MKKFLSICLLAVMASFLAIAPAQAATVPPSKPAVSKVAHKNKKHHHKGKKHKKHKGGA